jgi:uncharacterized protein (DUF2062 family)
MVYFLRLVPFFGYHHVLALILVVTMILYCQYLVFV